MRVATPTATRSPCSPEAGAAFNRGVDGSAAAAGRRRAVRGRRRSRSTRPSRSGTRRSRCSATRCAPRSTSAPGCGDALSARAASHRPRAQPRPGGRRAPARRLPPAGPPPRGLPARRGAALDRGADDRVRRRHRGPRGGLGRSSSGPSPAYGDDWWFTGLLAFVRQEQGRFDEAMDLSCRSLAEEPGAGHSAHARAHAHYETGDHDAGLAWMDDWVRGDGAVDRQPQPLLLARRPARALARRPRRGPAPVRRRSCVPSTGWAAGRWSTPARCSSAGRSPRTPPTSPT